eukprot:361073_1
MAARLSTSTTRLCLLILITCCILFIVLFIHYVPNPNRILEETTPISVSQPMLRMHLNDVPLEGVDIAWIKNIWNSENNSMTTCDPNQYKYTQLLLRDLIASNLNDYRVKTTSRDIENDYREWKDLCWTKKKKNSGRRAAKCYWWKKKLRIQIIDHEVYVSASKYEVEGHMYDKEGYRTGLFFYLCHLLRKYAKYLPDTDLIWYYHDFKKNPLNRFNWKRNGHLPYFFSDYNLAHLTPAPASNLLLFTISRAYLKYRYFAGIKSAHALINRENRQRIMDYLHWLKVINNKTLVPLLAWDNKTINKALFRGANNAKYRDQLYQALINNTYIYDTITSKYFDVSMTAGYALTSKQYLLKHILHFNNHDTTLSLEEQLQYRYMIVLDGVSVRDSLMYQMQMGAVILKQLTPNYEWWYFDLINGHHWILFENISHLMSIVINIVNQVDGYYRSTELNGALSKREYSYLLNHSMTSYTYDTLREITENSKAFIDQYLDEASVDCWFIHMIQIYNKYLFDVESLNKSSDEFMRLLPSDLYK